MGPDGRLPALQVRGVTKVFGAGAGAVRALRWVDARVDDGEFVYRIADLLADQGAALIRTRVRAVHGEAASSSWTTGPSASCPTADPAGSVPVEVRLETHLADHPAVRRRAILARARTRGDARLIELP